jgi:hypothetical protein
MFDSSELTGGITLSALTQTPQSNATNLPDLLTVSEIATILHVSDDTAIRYFANFPGVINLGSPEDVKRHKRQYRALRVPRAVLDKFLHDNRVR